MEFTLSLLAQSIGVAVFASLSIKFVQPLVIGIADLRKQKLLNNVLALVFGIVWSFALFVVEGFSGDAPSIVNTIMRGFFGAGLSVFGYEFFKHTLAFVSPGDLDE